MKKSVLLVPLMISSCVLPHLDLVDDPAVGGTSGSSAGGQKGGSSSAGAGNNDTGGMQGGGAQSGSGGSASAGGMPQSGSAGTSSGSGGEPVLAAVGGAGGEGECPTEPKVLECHGFCYDPTSDLNHCGNCDTVCEITHSCVDSKCSCPAGKAVCETASCVPTDDEKHCGNCQTQCAGVESCEGGKCVECPTGCATVNVPATIGNWRTDYSISLNPARDLRGASISARVYYDVEPGTEVSLGIWASTESAGMQLIHDSNHAYQTYTLKVPATGPWVLTDKIQITALGNDSAASKVYVDWIRVDSDVVGPWEFQSSAAPLIYDDSLSTVKGTLGWDKK